MRIIRERAKTDDEAGLSLVEMVVAIVVFAIIAVSAYPLFFKSVQLVSLNNLTTAATVQVNDMLEDIRVSPTCSTIETLAGTSDVFSDKRGVQYRIRLVLPDGCEEGERVPFEVTATRVKDGKLLLQNSDYILIPPRNGLFELD